jgi:benzoyl-CoA-dihydrodiol lyase
MWRSSPPAPRPSTPRATSLWALRAFRELDDALLQLRTNHLDIGLVLLRTEGDPAQVLAHDAALAAAREHWFVNEVLRHMARVLRRLDLTSRSFFALGEVVRARAGLRWLPARAGDGGRPLLPAR